MVVGHYGWILATKAREGVGWDISHSSDVFTKQQHATPDVLQKSPL